MKNTAKKITIGLILTTLLVVGAPSVLLAADNTTSLGLGIGRLYGNMITVVADFLGMTPDDIRTERREGKSITEIASDKDVSQDELIEAIVGARQDNLQDAVENEKITQEQADFCLEQMEERITANLERTETGRPAWGRGQGRGFGQGHGPGRGRNGVCVFNTNIQ